MSSFGDDPIKDLGFVVFPASAGLDQRDCLFLCFLVASLENTKTKSFMLTFDYVCPKSAVGGRRT